MLHCYIHLGPRFLDAVSFAIKRLSLHPIHLLCAVSSERNIWSSHPYLPKVGTCRTENIESAQAIGTAPRLEQALSSSKLAVEPSAQLQL